MMVHPRAKATNELQLDNNNKRMSQLHGSAFSGQCNLLAQHDRVAQKKRRIRWTGQDGQEEGCLANCGQYLMFMKRRLSNSNLIVSRIQVEVNLTSYLLVRK